MAVDAITDANRRAWNARRFNAWLSAFGPPRQTGSVGLVRS